MFRTTTNLLGQITTAVVVDNWVGREDTTATTPASGIGA